MKYGALFVALLNAVLLMLSFFLPKKTVINIPNRPLLSLFGLLSRQAKIKRYIMFMSRNNVAAVTIVQSKEDKFIESFTT